ncbi:MAG TPA: AAA family ATPase [Oscillatoriales cyanobacterium M59_W2019_021]|nr:MAG: AAA family ATPase [Cyanobacteria bacterium J055]HIK32462.1 AAA family ATPase [Oscillatoriales cyanobacterium M4454_W2019_049]HIK50215.1 AAA family ATPase [Oscillatoriales cyanobacterium M59_W2019_021]
MVNSNATPSVPEPVASQRTITPNPGETANSPPKNVHPDDLNRLLDILPDDLQRQVQQHSQRESTIEIVMDLGRLPEARFPGTAEYLSDRPITREDLQYCIDRVGQFSGDNRAGIERTLHRISAIRNRQGEIVGLTCRVGRAVYGTIGLIRDLVETGQSILMLGRPGVGKTTALREVARVLADDLQKRVVIIDTSNEIAGDGDIPHPAIGRARRMQVARPELQHQVMIEAVENHMPEVIVIDEIGTELEALAARTIAERGVQLVGTAHGNRIENLIKNPTLADLIGGIQSVTLGDDEARRRGTQKTVLERKAPPTFAIAVEMLERYRWVIHERVAETVDTLLRGRQPNPQVRTMSETGKVTVTHELGSAPAVPPEPPEGRGWRSSGQMRPLPKLVPMARERDPERRQFQELLETSLPSTYEALDAEVAETRDEDVLHVYPYAISRHQIEQVIQVLDLPVALTKDMDSADVILALRSQVKNHTKLRHISKARQIPLHLVKSSTISQITRALRRLLNMDDPGVPDVADLQLFAQNGSDDEIEALEEARLAVEQIVIPKGQPVELLPRSPNVRKMQHELVEHYRLKSDSFGDEPNRRLRIYPA